MRISAADSEALVRALRIMFAGALYQVTARGNNRQPIESQGNEPDGRLWRPQARGDRSAIGVGPCRLGTMKVLRVYVDTSVLGGCFDPEFERWSTGLMEDFRVGRFRPVLSEVTAAEVLLAPEPVRDLYAELLDLGAEVLPVSRETLALRASYEAHRVLGRRFENDMLHIAAATIAEVDVLVS